MTARNALMETWPRLRTAAVALATLVIYAGCVTIDPLTIAANDGNAVELERLLDAGGDVDLADPSGTTLVLQRRESPWRRLGPRWGGKREARTKIGPRLVQRNLPLKITLL